MARPPSGPLWVHEIKHDGYRLMVRRDGSRVRCLTRNGHDWADRFLVMSKPPPGEVTSDFHPLRNQRRGSEAVLFAFDLTKHGGDDLGNLPLIDHKRRLAELIGKAQAASRHARQTTAFPKNWSLRNMPREWHR